MNRVMEKILLLAMLVPSFSSADTGTGPRDLAFFLDRLAGEDMWLAPFDDERAFMASSNQPVALRDCNGFLRRETVDGVTWNVLVDMDGPGVVTRFWTAGDFEGALGIVIDGRQVVTTTLREFFGGDSPPFGPPLVLDHAASSGGRVSYFPIPFARHILIRSDSESSSFYWQINYSLFSRGDVVSFDGRTSDMGVAALDRAEARFLLHDRPENSGVERVLFAPEDIPVYASMSHRVDGPGIIREMSFTLPAGTWGKAGDIQLRMSHDGFAAPSVVTTLADMGGLGGGASPHEAMYSSFDGRTVSFRMPMPVGTGMTLTVTNQTESPLAGLRIGLGVDASEKSDMRLHVRTRQDYPEFGKLLTMEDIPGRGVFAGFSLVSKQPTGVGPDFFHQEGNEYMTLDGGKQTVWRGTGTEDYFNCGYYYRNGTVTCPLHGCLVKDPAEGGTISAYRIQKLDALPFRDGCLVSLEPGCPKKGRDRVGSFRLDYRWTSFWYAPID